MIPDPIPTDVWNEQQQQAAAEARLSDIEGVLSDLRDASLKLSAPCADIDQARRSLGYAAKVAYQGIDEDLGGNIDRLAAGLLAAKALLIHLLEDVDTIADSLVDTIADSLKAEIE